MKGELDDAKKIAFYDVFGRGSIGCLRFRFTTGNASRCGYGLR
jgi:hypothetical protein